MLSQIKLMAILSIIGLLFASMAYCVEDVTDNKEETDQPEEKATFTQGQLAVAIVRSLGLEDEIGFDQSIQGYMTFLQSRGIAPIVKDEDGNMVRRWDSNAEVTKEVFAVVVVQTLGLISEVQNKTDVNSYFRVLADRDIQINTTGDVRQVLSNIFVVNAITDIIGTSGGSDRPLSNIAGF